MQILASSHQDIDAIFEMYDMAIDYQKKVFHKHWEFFERDLIVSEINEDRQWKFVIDGKIICIFALSFNDEQFWKEKNNSPSLYIHRIVTHPDYKGLGFMSKIIDWAKTYCKEYHKEYIRMDTWGDNQQLIDYYIHCGFEYVTTIMLDKVVGLPSHYKGPLALLEIKIL